mmetsp:Transcript_13577/g.25473  ORF Transcript_13577/g.25473 Transcript_13577/m.25473 type:complete len:571 (-) Transcript_13577:7435-9147(-)
MKMPLDKLTTHANSYAAAHGLQVQVKQNTSPASSSASASYQCAPISLLPNAFPYSAFQNAQTLAPDFNILVDRISRDGEFLTKTLGGEHGVISKDEYTRKLLELYTDIYMNGDNNDENSKKKPNFAKEADVLGIHRSDYMLHPLMGESGEEVGYGLKQVELNTIAASFAGLATNVAGLHKMLTERFAFELKEWLETNRKIVMGSEYTPSPDVVEGVPTNPALVNLPKAMSVAHLHYKSRFATATTTSDCREERPPEVILFVVQEGETNTVDQRMLEFQLWNNHQIPVVRMSLTKAKSQLQLDEETGALYILPDVSADGSYGSVPLKSEVSIVYFRAGYAPTDYPDGYDGIEWQSRELIERSRATKCPQLGYHLAGTKKVQQELARPGVLERFFERDGNKSDLKVFSDNVDLKRMRDAFAGLYSLGEDAVKEDFEAVKEAISGNEGQYVLKPQREGGGYNYYGEKLANKLRENVTLKDDGSLTLGEDLAEFILMQRLSPPKQRAILLRGGLVEGTGDSISELGCFGTIVRSHDGKILRNEYAGFLLRTKFSNVDEGGVASGFATLSSPYLC